MKVAHLKFCTQKFVDAVEIQFFMQSLSKQQKFVAMKIFAKFKFYMKNFSIYMYGWFTSCVQRSLEHGNIALSFDSVYLISLSQ